MTLAAAPEALQGAVAAGILGCGSVVLGASESAGRFLAEIAQRAGASGDLRTAALEVVREYRGAEAPDPRIRSPAAPGADPRAAAIAAGSRRGGHRGRAHATSRDRSKPCCRRSLKRGLTLNVSGAIPAVLLDAGYPLAALKGVPLLARTAGLIAHLLEEQQRAIGFVMSHAAAQAIDYDGDAPPGFKPSEDA